MTISFEHMQPGDDIPEFVSVPITPEMLHGYAKASGDSNPLHLDPSFAQKAGFDNVIVHGMLGMALLGHLLRAHFAPEHIRSFSARFLSVIPVGKKIRCQARVVENGNGQLLLDLFARVDGAEQVAISGQAVIGRLEEE